MTTRNRKTLKHENRDGAVDEPRDLSIEHRANIVDQNTGQAFAQLEFPTVDGRDRIEVPRSDLVKPSILLNKMLDKNADLGIGDDVKRALELVRHAAGQLPRFRCEYAAKTGWQQDFSAYSTRDEVIGRGNTERYLLPPRQEGKRALTAKARGDLERWKREVAAPTCHANIGRFMLAVGFAPPLLELLNVPSFGINLFGDSKKGKSTLLLAARSIYGARVESDLTNFAATVAALGETCRFHNSTLLPLNEAGLIRGDRKEAYKVIRPCIFSLTEGREYQRHSKSAYAVAEDLSQYALLFAATAEHPMSFYAAEAGQVQDDGELARCTDVQLLRAGCVEVMDRNLDHVEVGPGETVSSQILKSIRSGCARNGGALPILSFVERIMDDPEEARQEAERLQTRFMALFANCNFDEVDRHRAKCFGVIAAAGQLACRWGFLPISETAMLAVVMYTFWQACQTRARIADTVREIQEHLRTKLATLPGENDPAARQPDCEGFWQGSSERRYCVHEASFKRWFSDHPGRYVLLLKWLKERNAFVEVVHHASGAAARNPYSHTNKWPDGKPTRHVILRHEALLRDGALSAQGNRAK